MIKSHQYFLLLLFVLIAVFFSGAFNINFIADDFYFLKISRVSEWQDIVGFFSPLRTTFYRPLASEVFYSLLTLTGRTVVIGHAIVFIIYGIGVYALYQCIKIVSKKELLAHIATLLYALHLTHVFQLYSFNTFQEILMFNGLAWSFLSLLQKQQTRSYIFFIIALLSKETALLYPFFLMLMGRKALPFFILSLTGLLLYLPGAMSVSTTETTYSFLLSPKLILNNLFWYSAWSLGAPNFLPDHMRSIFGPVLPTLWPYFNLPFAKIYIVSLLLYMTGLGIGFTVIARKKNPSARSVLLMLGFFLLFLAPTLPITHKWMVRLTLPLIPVILAQAWIIYALLKQNRVAGIALIILSLIANFSGVKLHEITSNYRAQSNTSELVQRYFIQHRQQLSSAPAYYFADPRSPRRGTPWGWSKQLENTLHGSDFIDHAYPGSHARAVYGYRTSGVASGLAPQGVINIPATLFVP